MCRTAVAPPDLGSLDEAHGLEFQKYFRTIEWNSELFRSHGLEVKEARYFSESRTWWMDYRATANISEAEKKLILQDDDRWIALGLVVGRKG